MSEAEGAVIVDWLSVHPEAGDLIEGTGGARKVRGPDIPVFLLEVFAKNEKSDLTAVERQTLKTVLAEIVEAYKSKRKGSR